MHPGTPRTDTVNLLHQALDAIDLGRSAQAIALLCQVLRVQPGSAEAHYLLGAEQARLGMPARAVASLRTALACDPEHDAARLRLGMLLLGEGRLADAQAMWQPLNRLNPDDPFYQFKTGLLLIAQGEPEAGIGHLQRGLTLSHINVPLNAEMRRAIDEARAVHA